MRDPLHDFLVEKKREMQEALVRQSLRSKDAIDELEARCLMLSAQKIEVSSRLTGLENENTQLHNRIQTLELELVNNTNRITNISEIDSLRTKLSNLELELQTALNGWKASEQIQNQSYHEKVSENNILLRKISTLEQEVNEVDKSNSRYIEETAEHTSALEQKLHKATREYEAVNAGYREKCSDINSLQIRINQLESSLQSALVGWNTSDNTGNIALTNKITENDALKLKLISLEQSDNNTDNKRVTELEEELERALQGWTEADRGNIQNIELQKKVLQLEATVEEQEHRRQRDEKQLELVLDQLSLGEVEQSRLKQQQPQQLSLTPTPILEPNQTFGNNVGIECAMLRKANQDLERQLTEAKQSNPNLADAFFETQKTLDVLRIRFQEDIQRLETEVGSRDTEISILQQQLRGGRMTRQDRLLESPEFV